MINKLAIAETEKIEPLRVNTRTTKAPCLILSFDPGETLKPLLYANTNSIAEFFKDGLQACATFPNRRAVFVVEKTTKLGTTVQSRMIEFYEYEETIGWKFKKQYREQQE